MGWAGGGGEPFSKSFVDLDKALLLFFRHSRKFGWFCRLSCTTSWRTGLNNHKRFFIVWIIHMCCYPIHSWLNAFILSHKKSFLRDIFWKAHILQWFCISLIHFITYRDALWLRRCKTWHFYSWNIIWFFPTEIICFIFIFLISHQYRLLSRFCCWFPDLYL